MFMVNKNIAFSQDLINWGNRQRVLEIWQAESATRSIYRILRGIRFEHWEHFVLHTAVHEVFCVALLYVLCGTAVESTIPLISCYHTAAVSFVEHVLDTTGRDNGGYLS